MYEFYYNYIERKFNAKLMFTETDNLLYETETNDVYEDFSENKDLFGFSDYPRDSKFFDPVIGKTKDEFKGKIITEFNFIISLSCHEHTHLNILVHDMINLL